MVYITTNESAETAECCDELIRVAGTKNAEAGNMVSPQFSLLMLLDVLFAYYFANNTYYKVKIQRNYVRCSGKCRINGRRKFLELKYEII